MYKKKIELIKSIIYESSDPVIANNFYGKDNQLYRSLKYLFNSFWIYHKKELYLVGGCVRDLLLGKEPKDYDLCTNATPDEVKDILKEIGLKSFDSGIKHGTITIIDEFYHQQYEITTYRVDGKYTDGRHPDEVKFTPSLEEDLKRRDFTINSFAYNLLNNEVVMINKLFLDDLHFGIIRTVGDPTERFEEDALRMLRAIRFSAQLNFSIDNLTYNAISICSSLILKISKERIRDELTKILLSDNPQNLEFIVASNLEINLFNGLRPITDMLNCEHQNPWHYTDVFHHTMDVVRRVPKEFNLRWAALLHDIGKPKVKELKPGTTDHYRYIGHPEESVKIADIIMDILKFSNDQKEIIHTFILYHDYPFNKVGDKKFKLKLVEIGEENFPSFIKLLEADALSHRLSMSEDFAIKGISEIKERFIKHINNPQPLRIKDLALNGDDLIELGYKPGPCIGVLLNLLLDYILDNPEENNRESLISYLEKQRNNWCED